MFKKNIKYTLATLLLISTYINADVPNAPGAYVGVSKLGNATNAVRISTQDNSNNEDGFIFSLYDYSTSTLLQNIMVNGSENNTVYGNIMGLTCDKLYQVVVVAYNNEGNSSQSDLRAFNIHSTLGVECPVQAVNIADYGAIPDDGIDDTQAISSALDVSGSITMPTGTYNVKELTRTGKTIIDGNNSVFISELDTSNNGRTSKNILTLSGSQIEIKNLTLNGAYTNGNAKPLNNVSSLLHIYDSQNILLDNVDTINHSSNWWSSFDYSQLNNDHTKDYYSAVYIAFSNNITINNMEQKGNIKTEGLTIYDSDDININNFDSHNAPNIWTSLNILASDNITLTDINVTDGSSNASGSSINFVANYDFNLTNVTTINKQGFDMSNETTNLPIGFTGRITRDTSFGTIDNCHFQGERALHAYPTINKAEGLIFKNTKFIPTKAGSFWAVRFQKAGDILFDNCTFGNENVKIRFNMIMGDTENLVVKNSNFINTEFTDLSSSIYLLGATFGDINISNNYFSGIDSNTILARYNSFPAPRIINKLIDLNNTTTNSMNGRSIQNGFNVTELITDN